MENPLSKKEVRKFFLFDQGSQRSYITKRIKNILDLKPYSKESISISTFGKTKSQQNCLEKVSLKVPARRVNETKVILRNVFIVYLYALVG